MSQNSLQTFIGRVRPAWGPLSSELVASCCSNLEELLQAPATEAWLGELENNLPEYKELYRDPAHGFVLLAHAEFMGRYRSPHDHGRGWVIYAVQQGEMEIGTYVRMQESDGKVKLVKRGVSLLRPGEASVFLPGDIHDTRCTAGTTLYYRFTDRDLRKEEKEERKVTRYVEQGGIWTVGAA